jgi:hypothetical protein
MPGFQNCDCNCKGCNPPEDKRVEHCRNAVTGCRAY